MIHYKSKEEIELIRDSSLLVSEAIAEVGKEIRPGIDTLSLDNIAETYIRDNGGVPAFLDYKGFPNSVCISVNEAVVHGIPDKTELKDGDIVSIDIGVVMNGFFGDSAYTFTVGEVSEEYLHLIETTKVALQKGIGQVQIGKRLGDVMFAIQEHVEINNDYHVVRDLVGHGIGRDLHEEPEVPNFGKKGQGIMIKEGLVIAIEPMVNFGSSNVGLAEDDWTILTVDRKPSAHFEHTVAVGENGVEVLTSFDVIEEIVTT